MTICSLFMFRELMSDDLSFAVVAKQLKKVDPMLASLDIFPRHTEAQNLSPKNKTQPC